MPPGRISGERRQDHRGPALAAGIGDPHDQERRDIDHLNARECHVDGRLQAGRVTWTGQQRDRRRDLLAEAERIARRYVHGVQLAASLGCRAEMQSRQ